MLFGLIPIWAVGASVGWSPLLAIIVIPAYVFLSRTCGGSDVARRRLDSTFAALLIVVISLALGARGEVELAVPLGLFVIFCGLMQKYWRFHSTTPILLVFSSIFVAYSLVGVTFSPELRFGVSVEQRVVGLYLILSFLAVAFTAVVIVNALIMKRTRPKQLESVAIIPISPTVALVTAVIAFFAYHLLDAVGVADAIGAGSNAIRVVGWVPLVYMVFYCARRGYVVAGYAIAGADLLLGFGTSLLYAGTATALVLYSGFVIKNRRVPVAALTLIALAALQLNVVKDQYRTESGSTASASSLGIISGIRAFSDVAYRFALDVDPAKTQKAAYRFTYTADLLAYTSDSIPRLVAFPEFRPITVAPLMLVPRWIWSGKPRADFGNVYGQSLGTLDADDSTTAANVAAPIEGYLLGGVGFMLLFGAGFGLLVGLYGRIRGPDRPGTVAIGAVTTAAFLRGVESDSTTYLAFALIAPLLAWLAIKLLAALSRSFAPDYHRANDRQPITDDAREDSANRVGA